VPAATSLDISGRSAMLLAFLFKRPECAHSLAQRVLTNFGNFQASVLFSGLFDVSKVIGASFSIDCSFFYYGKPADCYKVQNAVFYFQKCQHCEV
jgi:hypothetical protein